MPRWDSLEALLDAVDDASGPWPSLPLTVSSRRADGDTPLHIVATWGDAKAVGMLVRAGADVNAVGDLGSTPLYAAVLHGHVAAARPLLAAGASPSYRDAFGRSAAELAARSGSSELAGLFGGPVPETENRAPGGSRDG